MMNLVRKLKEVAICMAPIIGIVLVLHFCGLAHMDNDTFVRFVIGTALVFFGQIFFLVGVDNGIMPMGEMVGSTVTRKGTLWTILIFGFVFGFLATVAEPGVQVLAMQLNSVYARIANWLLVVVVSIGGGAFIGFALFRILKNIKFSTVLTWTYIAVFGLAIVVQIVAPEFVAVAFDGGGVTTGPVTVPFVLALGTGVAAVRSGSRSEDSFGVVGMSSAGPILAMLIMALFFVGGQPSTNSVSLFNSMQLGETALKSFGEVVMALSPIIVIFLFFQFVYIKLSAKRLRRLLVDSLVMLVGLWLFLMGVKYGFSATGAYLGEALASLDFNWVLLPIAVLVGAAVIYTEPSVLVLGKQVEQVTNGQISNRVLLHLLAACIGIATAIGVSRAMWGINLMYFLVPGYIISIVLMFFTPPIFTAIAFDSGGVASGTLTSTFIVPFVFGICIAMEQNILMFAFGIVSIIAMMPLISLQALGVLYRIKSARHALQASPVALEGASADQIIWTKQDLLDDIFFGDLPLPTTAGQEE